MESIGAYEAKTHLPELLKRVAEGQSIAITKHGVPIAVLVPYDPDKKFDVRTIIQSLREFRADKTLEGLSIREIIDQGRR
jgi:prevent-host-death family protein